MYACVYDRSTRVVYGLQLMLVHMQWIIEKKSPRDKTEITKKKEIELTTELPSKHYCQLEQTSRDLKSKV